MQFWYALHRQLWWCLVGVITIVQCIFGALFLGIGCSIFLVLRLWCYALLAPSRRLATALAHLLYIYFTQFHLADQSLTVQSMEEERKRSEKSMPPLLSWQLTLGSKV